jgi:predicted transcriptional regulator of viral defense system
MAETPSGRPDWNLVYATAELQDGLFTIQQAADAGCSPQLLVHHLRGGRVVRIRRGIYRLVNFPRGEHEDLVAAWLWSDRVGVISHQTALSLHGLSDVLPAKVHLTLPSAWRRRRLRAPPGVVLHHADVPAEDQAWFGAVPTTGVRRTLNDCARDGLSPDLLRQGARQALQRGLVTNEELPDVDAALAPFGGVAA